ncbi:WD40 repeat-like protein, partial [Polyporus arcularius HHB13444]
SPDGRYIATSAEDDTIIIWSEMPFSQTLSLHVSLQDHTRLIAAACFSPCERYVATSSEDFTVRLWSVGDGSLVCTFVNHHITVVHLVFSADGKTLVSADMAGRVCVHALSMFVRDAPLCLE